MKITVNRELLDKARYNMKARKLWKKMVACMGEDGAISCAETTARVLYLMPNHLQEALIDDLLQTIEKTKERFEQLEEGCE